MKSSGDVVRRKPRAHPDQLYLSLFLAQLRGNQNIKDGVFNGDEERQQRQKSVSKKRCIIRESNTGLVDGNDEFYH